MSRCDCVTLQKYFEDYGWVYRFDGKDLFYSGWRSNQRSYSLKVKLSESLIFFEVKLLALSAFVRKKHWDEILEYILDLNGRLTIVRLSIDEDYAIILSSESFTDEFTYDYLTKMLGIIGYFTEKLQKEILSKVGELCAFSESPQYFS